MASGHILGILCFYLMLHQGYPEINTMIGILAREDSPWRTALTNAYESLRSKGDIDGNLVGIASYTYNSSFDLKVLVNLMDIIESTNIAVIVGPYQQKISDLANTLELPYLVTEEIGEFQIDFSRSREDTRNTFFLYPHHIWYLQKPLEDLIVINGWKDINIIYDGLGGVQVLGGLVTALPDRRVRPTLLEPHISEHDLRKHLIGIRQGTSGVIILACDRDCAPRILKQALDLSMLTFRYNWIIVTLNPDSIDFSPWAYTGVNLTSFRLLHDVSFLSNNRGSALDEAVARDAFYTVERWRLAIQKDNITCQRTECWLEGKEILKTRPRIDRRAPPTTKDRGYPFKSQIAGATGWIQFDDLNRRTNLSIDVVGLNQDGLFKKAVWMQSGITTRDRYKTIPHDDEDMKRVISNPIGKRTARVVTILEAPFTMLKENHEKLTGNDKYRGYCIDLIEMIAEYVGFEYELYLVPDGQFGADDGAGNWNGMIGELQRGNADMAVTSMSITAEREEAVDFTKPFKDVDISVLIKRPKTESSIFQFLKPLDPKVWGLTMLAFIVTSLLLFAIDRIIPNNIHDPEKPRFDINMSLWFSFASLVQAGAEDIPHTAGGRVLSSAWWFFSLILISSYTANLAAFLTVTKINAPISSVADLADSKMDYGTVTSTRSERYFKNSKSETFQKMYTQMSDVKPQNMVTKTAEGNYKVLNENYAFIWDSLVNLYTATQNCETMIIGGSVDSKNYGIGVPRGATYRDDLTMAILRLSEEGFLKKLDKRWWTFDKCGDPTKSSPESDTESLDIDNVAGVFLCLTCLLILALMVAVAEFLIRKFFKSRKTQKSDTNHTGNGNGILDVETNETPA